MINITSLIDVMFLLLIFFMVSSTFRDRIAIQVDLPEAATGSPQDDVPHEITVLETGDIYFAGALVTDAALRGQLESLATESPDAPVLLRADAGTPFQRVLTAFDIARDVGIAQIIIPNEAKEQMPPALLEGVEAGTGS